MDWPTAVMSVARCYSTTFRGIYISPSSKKCPLPGMGNVCLDCSGFVSACVDFFARQNNRGTFRNHGTAEWGSKDTIDELAKIGFRYTHYPNGIPDNVFKPFDIYVIRPSERGGKHGHAQIVAGNGWKFSWGASGLKSALYKASSGNLYTCDGRRYRHLYRKTGGVENADYNRLYRYMCALSHRAARGEFDPGKQRGDKASKSKTDTSKPTTIGGSAPTKAPSSGGQYGSGTVFDVQKVFVDPLPQDGFYNMWKGSPPKKCKNMAQWCNAGQKQCSGVVCRALINLGIRASSPDPRGAADWCKKSNVYVEVDARAVLKAPQLGDIVTYACVTSGSTGNSYDPVHKTNRIGHTVMWLPCANGAKGKVWTPGTPTAGHCCWSSDHQQTSFWTYPGHTKFIRLRAFRWVGPIKDGDGRVFSSNLNIPRANFDYNGGLEGDKNNLEQATTSGGGGSWDDSTSTSMSAGPRGSWERRRKATPEEIKQWQNGGTGTGGGTTSAYNVSTPKPSQGSWPSTLDMRALLEFLHAYPFSTGGRNVKQHKKNGSMKGTGWKTGNPRGSAYLCSAFCRLAILYGFGQFTWAQSQSWDNEYDVKRDCPRIGWASTGGGTRNPMNGGVHGMNYRKWTTYGTGKSASDNLISKCKSGQIPPGTMFHCTHGSGGSNAHVFIWGGDELISDYAQGLKVVNDPQNISELTSFVPDCKVINPPAGGVNYANLMSNDGSGGSPFGNSMRLVQDENGEWWVEEYGYTDENGNWITLDPNTDGMGGGTPVLCYDFSRLTWDNVIKWCPQEIIFKQMWVRYMMMANFHAGAFGEMINLHYEMMGGYGLDGEGIVINGESLGPSWGNVSGAGLVLIANTEGWADQGTREMYGHDARLANVGGGCTGVGPGMCWKTGSGYGAAKSAHDAGVVTGKTGRLGELWTIDEINRAFKWQCQKLGDRMQKDGMGVRSFRNQAEYDCIFYMLYWKGYWNELAKKTARLLSGGSSPQNVQDYYNMIYDNMLGEAKKESGGNNACNFLDSLVYLATGQDIMSTKRVGGSKMVSDNANSRMYVGKPAKSEQARYNKIKAWLESMGVSTSTTSAAGGNNNIGSTGNHVLIFGDSIVNNLVNNGTLAKIFGGNGVALDLCAVGGASVANYSQGKLAARLKQCLSSKPSSVIVHLGGNPVGGASTAKTNAMKIIQMINQAGIPNNKILWIAPPQQMCLKDGKGYKISAAEYKAAMTEQRPVYLGLPVNTCCYSGSWEAAGDGLHIFGSFCDKYAKWIAQQCGLDPNKIGSSTGKILENCKVGEFNGSPAIGKSG